MPRPPKATWIDPRPSRGGGFWITRAFGEISEKTGRRKGVRNFDIGPPTGRDRAANRAAAQRWVDGLIADEAAAVRRGDSPTVADLADQFCEWSSKHKERRTVASHAERLRTFCRFRGGGTRYGDREAGTLKPGDLARMIRAMKEDGCAPGYINSIILSVNAMYNWAVRPVDDRSPERILRTNPFIGVEKPKTVAPPKRYCGPEARRAFLKYAHKRACRQKVGTLARRFDRLTVQLLRLCESSGCRPGEACRLEWGHIDWEDHRAVLKGKSTHATGKQRVVPLTGSMARILHAIERLPDRHERFVFTHQARDGNGRHRLAGLPWTGNAIQHKIRKWRDGAIKAGLTIAVEGADALTLYAFRRDMGADVLRMTGSHAASAEVLGHSVAINERYYSSFADEYAVDLAKRVEESRKAAKEGVEKADEEAM